MNELALFAGAGGGILGGYLLGWRTVCAVEFAAYPRRVLLARQRDGMLPRFPIWDDVRTFDGNPWRGKIDVVSGGFPCTDISAAGKGAGIEGEHSGLWSEMARIIGEVRPRFVFVENSPLLVARGAAVVIGDLAALGYDAQWCCISASECGAPHKRDRFWLVGYASGIGWDERRNIDEEYDGAIADTNGEYAGEVADDTQLGWGTRRQGRLDSSGTREPELALSALANTNGMREPQPQGIECDQRGRAGNSREDVSNTLRDRLEERLREDREQSTGESSQGRTETWRSGENVGDADSLNGRPGAGRNNGAEADDASGWPTEPDVGRVAHGMAARVDRLKAIGNGQVPRVAATAWRILTHNVKLTSGALDAPKQE